MTAAIYFHPEAYTTSGPKLMGRNAAGESFLRGFLRHSKAGEFWAVVEQAGHAQAFGASVRAYGRNEQIKVIDRANIPALSQPGAMYYPGPGIGQYAWQRTMFGDAAWSLCGITHTTASGGAMDNIAELLTAPVQPWDALICTSTAVRDNVQRILQAQADYLVRRVGATRVTLPQLPVIPLGIHTEDFVFTDVQKADARSVIGAGERTLVVLFTGRLSFHAKAHPLAMYQALEQAAKGLPDGASVVLVECGWHANDAIANAYEEAAAAACPSVRVVTLDGRKPEDRQTAWAAADIFCSLSDNIQETFGIVPIEAMAAGLPVVVSDWDGYKDTVRDGVDGMRVPTWMPAPGFGGDLALRHAYGIDTYDMYCGHACSLTAVDVDATAQAFSRLFSSPELRRTMGDAGRHHAREIYDWAAIIPQYESLWSQLNDLRKAQSPNVERQPHPWPARMDPFAAFQSYPTQILSGDTLLILAGDNAVPLLAKWRSLMMVNFAKYVIPTEGECNAVLVQLEGGPRRAIELVQAFPPERQAFMLRGLAWLAKLGIVKVAV